MWIANLAIALIILGCVAYQYLKSHLVKSFATVIITICASSVAFGYFELLANVIIAQTNGTLSVIVPWAQPLSVLLLFVLAFALLQTIAAQITRRSVDLGRVPDSIGRIVCGIFLGLLLSGLLLTALAMAPLPNKYPYPRFSSTRPDADKPNKPLFNADGFAAGWFSIISRGSLSGQRSFAVLHPAFIDQTFLNRHKATADMSIVAGSDPIELPQKKKRDDKIAAAWPAPQGLKDAEGRPIPPKSGHNLMIVRVGMKKTALKEAGQFTLSQLRLICKQKAYAKNPLVGKARNVYPIGYVSAAKQLQIKRLDEVITVTRSDFEGSAAVRWIDFAFYVPSDFLPVLVEFKQNCVVQVPAIATIDEAPPLLPFTGSSDPKKTGNTPSRR